MRGLAALGLCLAIGSAFAEESNCLHDEVIVFSCHVSHKVASLCHPADQPHSLIYRYGVPGHIELSYPDAEQTGGAHFSVSDQPLYGGGLTSVAFERGGFTYALYSKVSQSGQAGSAERVPVFEDGLLVSKQSQVISTKICDDGGAGFREDVDWLPKR